MTVVKERRKLSIRQDINDLVRDGYGRLSPARIGLLVGQWLSVKVILEHGSEIIANWDSLLVLFTVLVAPDVLRKLITMKYSQGYDDDSRYRSRKGKELIRDLSRE